MATGEGKTLAAMLPAFLHSLSGGGVHVATPNAYLAGRDFAQTGPVLGILGVSVGLVPESASAEEKRAAYACDVTYATGYELGFDYLRDRLQAMRTPRPALGSQQHALLCGESTAPPAGIQPRRNWAIIDEIDSVLIDEACLPLVLSDGVATSNRCAKTYAEARRVAHTLSAGQDFVFDESQMAIMLTGQGMEKIYGNAATYSAVELERPWSIYVEQALRAELLHHRDVDYVVQDGKIVLVDEFTGRIFPDRSWRDGLHQAVEAKEGTPITADHSAATRISRQRFFRLYRKMCGMTGTAMGSQREFWRHYRLPVVPIPLAKACRRVLWPTRFFSDAQSKWQAVVREILKVHGSGRPVLVGSRTIENSELLARRLSAEGIAFQLLNGKQDREEAEIVARAGERAAITLATNMAGRGTDIRLGDGVAAQKGLHVIGVECHESQRIDRQLLGRAGWQGDPGSGRLFVSADDPLIRRFGAGLLRLMQRMPSEEGEILCDLSSKIAAVQRTAERAAYADRRKLLAHDQWLDGIGQAMK